MLLACFQHMFLADKKDMTKAKTKKKNENVDGKTQERVCPEKHPEINNSTLTTYFIEIVGTG
ncbi:unnamed protein product [Arabidopsis halleri]